MSGETPRYATLLYEVRRLLDVSFTEYVYLDMVHKLSYERWCNKSLEHTGNDLGISKRGVIKMRDRLIAKELLKRNVKGELRVTDLYIKLAVNKVPQSVNKVHFAGEQSAPKNNKRNTENFENEVEVVDKLGKTGRPVKPGNKWALEKRMKHAARKRLQYAVKTGKLVKADYCEYSDCTTPITEAHHPEYDKPLEVLWLCREHHLKLHNESENDARGSFSVHKERIRTALRDGGLRQLKFGG